MKTVKIHTTKIVSHTLHVRISDHMTVPAWVANRERCDLCQFPFEGGPDEQIVIGRSDGGPGRVVMHKTCFDQL